MAFLAFLRSKIGSRASGSEIGPKWQIKTFSEFYGESEIFWKIDLFKEASRLLSKEVDDELLLKILESSNSKFWSDSNSKVEVF